MIFKWGEYSLGYTRSVLFCYGIINEDCIDVASKKNMAAEGAGGSTKDRGLSGSF